MPVADAIRGKTVANGSRFSVDAEGLHAFRRCSTPPSPMPGNNAADIDELKVATVFVNEAPRMRRFKASAKGRASPRQKRSSHITIQVADE